MDAFNPFIMLVMSVLLVMSVVSALEPVTEKLLMGLRNSEVSVFTTTSYGVYHMEMDRFKPEYVMYTDLHVLKTSDGNTTETIAGNSTARGYKEGVGEDARFNYILGFTQTSPTQVIVSEYNNHCLRQVDRVTRATSVSAGQCRSLGYQDGASSKFNRPRAVIVDKKNSKQLLVVDEGNDAVRTVEIESKNVGTFIKSNQLVHMRDFVQDNITGDIYITNSGSGSLWSLYKLSYNTGEFNIVSYVSTGQGDGKRPGDLYGLFIIETVILVSDIDNKRIHKYDTAHNTWSTLNMCDVTKAHKNTNECVTESLASILLTSNRLLIGGYKKITSYKPACLSQNVTVYTDPHTGTAQVNLETGYSIELSEGTFAYETPGQCITTFNVINNLTEALTTFNPPATTPCTDSNITVYTDTSTGTAKVQLGEGLGYIDLPEGTHTYETLTAQNKTCTTRYQVIDNSTKASTTSIPPTVCTDSNITVNTDTHTGTARVELVQGLGYIGLSEGTHTYERVIAKNTTCITTFHVVDNSTSVPPQTLTCPEKQVAATSPVNGLATFQLKFGDQNHVLMLPLGQYQHIIKSSNQICNVTLDAEDYRVRHTLELVAEYSVDCSVVNSTVTQSLLKDVARQKYTVIEALCGSACKGPGDHSHPIISCDGVDDLKIRWPTDLVFTADVVSVPANILQTLEKRIRTSGPTLKVVLFGATPPIVYPKKAANGGYVSISLSTTCINGLSYSDIDKKCV